MKMPIDGGIITEARQTRGMSKHQLAEAMRVTPTCVNTWERGKAGVTGVTCGNWEKLCHLLWNDDYLQFIAGKDAGVEVTTGPVVINGAPLLSESFTPLPAVINLVLSPELAEALKQAASDQYRTVELQALWAIRMTLEAEGHLDVQGGEK